MSEPAFKTLAEPATLHAPPAGGKPSEDYQFEGAAGPVTPSELFGGKEALVTYDFMCGPQRALPSDPGQDSRDGDQLWPLWGMSDSTSEGRGTGGRPKLS